MKLNEFIYKLNKPILFKNILTDSTASNWTPELLARLLNDEKLNFRIGKRFDSKLQFENKCSYVSATVKEFLDWISEEKLPNSKKSKLNESNPFSDYDSNQYWAYADYKHMIDLLNNDEHGKVLDENCINWKCFGFENRNAFHSTMWLGTSEAYTPCHYDSYGYNFMAQIYGKKRWTLFSDEDTDSMYPTRIPFEESTVYSKINIKSPNLNKYPKFKNSRPFVVEMEPGDVLYVPHHWWHFVECVDLTISINTWVELDKKDDLMRLKEILSKTIIQSLMECNFISFEKWLNASEKYCSQEDNFDDIKLCLAKIDQSESFPLDKDLNKLEKLVENHPNFSKYVSEIDFKDYLNDYTLCEPIYSINNDNDSENEGDNEEDLKLTKCLAKAITNDKIIDLITKNFLDELSE